MANHIIIIDDDDNRLHAKHMFSIRMYGDDDYDYDDDDDKITTIISPRI